VIKIDNGNKGRFKQGLVKIDLSAQECIEWVLSRDSDESN